MFKGMVSGLTSFVSGLNSVIGALDKLGISTPVVLGALASMFMTLKGLGTDTAIPNLFKSLAPKTWGSIADTFSLVDKSTIKMGNSFSSTSKQVTKLANGASKYNGTMRVVSKGFTSTKLGAIAANVGVTALNAGMMALAGVGVSLAIKGIDNFVNRSEKLAEASRNRQAEIKGEIDTTKQQVSSLSEIAKEYDKLANKTNKSKEELKRFNELKQEVASISPELVMGYDENNNPILAINGSLEQTIALKKEILALNQQILAEEQKQEVEANRDKAERLWENQSYTKDKYSGGVDKAGNARKDAFDTVLYNKDVKSYKKSLADKKAAYNEYINDMSKARSEYNEIELKAQQSAITELNSSLSDKKLNDKTIQNINSVAGSFNWGQLSASETQQVQQGFENLNNSFSKFDAQGFQTKINNLSRDFEAGSISKDDYENGIGSLANTLIKAGVDVEKSTLIGALKQFPPELREIDYAMAGVLKNVGLKLSDLGSNVKADMLFKQMTNMSDLTNKFANSIEGTGTISVNLIPEIGSDIYESLPTQIQGAIDTIMADGSVSEQEAEILMKLMTSWEQDGEITSEELVELKELDGNVITPEIQAKLDADVSDDYRKYVINNTKEGQSLKNTISTEFKVEGLEESQNVVDVMDSLGLSTGEEQSNFLSTIEAQVKSGNMNLGDLKDTQSILDWLYAHPEVTSKYEIDVLGKESVDAVKKSLNELDLGEEEKKSIIMDIQEGDLNGLEESINKLPEEKRFDVVAEIGEALTSIGTVDAITLRDKLTKIFGIDLSKGTVDSADAYKKNTTKNANITATDNSRGTVNSADTFKKSMGKLVTITAIDLATKVIDGVNVSPVTKLIKVVAQKAGDAWNWLTGGGGKRSSSSGGRPRSLVGESQNTLETPIESQVAPVSSTFSTPKSTPTEGTTTSDSSSQVSTRSVGSFGSVLTNSTQSTKISKSYKNVLNMIKYGINLFQELENRISRTANQLDLLSIKMENTVGTKKISYLKQQNALYKEQAKLQKTLFKSLYSEKQSVQKKLKKSGFTINKQGNLTGYEERLLKLEKEAERAEKASSDYKGKSDKTKNRLEKSADAAKKKLDEAKKLTEEYLSLQYKELPAAEQEWYKLQNAIKETNDEIEKLKFEDKIKPFINDIDESAFKIDRLNSLLDRAETSANNSEGETKLKYLKKQVDYNNQLIKQNDILLDKTKGERKHYRNKLREYGFKFDKNGEFTNYDTVMDKYANSSDYDKVKKWADEYLDLGNDMRDALEASQDLQNSSKELNNEIKKLELENKVEPFTISVGLATQNITKLNNELDILDVKLKNAVGKEKIDLLDKQVKKWEELKKEQEKVLKGLKSEESTYQKSLSKYGFKFDKTGNMTNKDSMLSKLKNHKDYEYIKDIVDKWEELYNDSIPNAEKSILEYKNSVKDAYQSQLDITKDIEDKITNMYKDQIEKRKDAIKKETETITKELERQRKAYKDMRDEVDYQNDYKEKTDTISDLQKQLEIAKKDTSLSNRKKIADLEKQLAEAQKDLDKFVQDKIDSDIDNSFQEAIDKANEDSDKKIEDLENLWSDSKIAEAVKEALKTGLFTDINGEVSNLKDSLLGFAETSGELFGVTGNIIANEWCGNLDIALNTMNNLNSIMKNMEVPNFESTFKGANLETNSLTTGDISINVSAKTGANPEDIGDEVKKQFKEMLNQLKQGL